MPVTYIRKKKLTALERHYYREARGKVSEILDPSEQQVIDWHIDTHRKLPPYNTTREEGHSSFELQSETAVALNPSMLMAHKVRGRKDSVVIERLEHAPALPISCMAAAEHVLSLRDKVTDFVSEFEPATKKQVKFQILVKMRLSGNNFHRDSSALLRTILDADDQLKNNDLTVSFDRSKKLYIIEVSTQKGDIQQIVKAIKSKKVARIINCDFSDIGLHEGVCLLKGDASNPIHALVNIADAGTQKGFMERDAGLTSGLSTSTYKDSSWTFNFYKSLEEIQRRAGYSDKSIAVKLHMQP